MRTLLVLLGSVLVVGCSSNSSSSSSASASAAATSAPKSTASAVASASASAKPAEAPEVAAIKAGSWKDPGGGPDIKLADSGFKNCFGFDGYSMKLPEGTTTSNLMDARCCYVTLPGAKKDGYHMIVCTDELPVPWIAKTRDSLEKVKNKLVDEPDFFLYEVEGEKGTDLRGWFLKTIGPHKVRCNASQDVNDKEKLPLSYERAVLELCTTVAYKKP